MTASSVGFMRHQNQPHDNRDAFPIAWPRSVQHAGLRTLVGQFNIKLVEIKTLSTGTLHAERTRELIEITKEAGGSSIKLRRIKAILGIRPQLQIA